MATRSTPTQSARTKTDEPHQIKNWRNAESRTERGKLIREGLFKAAAEIVGDVGYKDTSVAMIVQRAGVAQGTFYNHFESRQDILDQLLPATGQQLLAYVKEHAKQGSTALEKEELSFDAFFSFLESNPHFFRILNEAESFAPKAYQAHLELVSKDYTKFFRRAQEHGELQAYDDREIEVIIFMLMAARSYLAWRFVYGAEKHQGMPKWVTSAYMKFLRHGLSAAPAPAVADAPSPTTGAAHTKALRHRSGK